ncbi:hypothetical protein AUP68_07544 [Ilyonectria robusta]
MANFIRAALFRDNSLYPHYRSQLQHDVGFSQNLEDESERQKLNFLSSFLEKENLFELSPHHPQHLNGSQRIALAIFGCHLLLDNRTRVNGQENQTLVRSLVPYIRIEMGALYDLAKNINNPDPRGQVFLQDIAGAQYDPWFQELLCCVGLVRMLAT